MRKILLFTILLLPAIAFAQAKIPTETKTATVYEIKGQAVDSVSKQEVPYATISFALGDAKNVIRRMACGLDGKFSTTFRRSGHYIITFQSMGYTKRILSVDLNDKKHLADFGKIFFSQGNEKLNEVVVTAIKPLVSVDADKITYSAETDPESKTSNVLDILRKVPLITVDGDDNIQLKGSSNFKIQLDGKPSTLISNNPKEVLKSMPASSIKDIQIITNPSSKYDAEGIGGIINIVTNKKKLQGYNGSVNAGVSSDKRVNGGLYTAAKIGKFDFSINYGTQYRNSRYTKSSTFQENYNDNTNRYLYSDGRSKNSGPFQYGHGEGSYEIDTLNLISMSFNRFQGNMTQSGNQTVNMRDVNNVLIQSYDNPTRNKRTFGSTSANVDYQRSFKKPEEVFTLSYQIEYNPNDDDNYSNINNTLNYTPQVISIYNKAPATEHTFQADYTDPITKIHSIEAGVKAILRRNKSNTGYWKDDQEQPDKENDFKYDQDIYAAYASYNLKLKKIGFKTGVRMEHTTTNGEYAQTNTDFDNHYTEFIPSASLSYQIGATKNVRFSYTQRIQRPGIWYINPYLNDSDPKNVQQGNPKLDPEKSNSFDLNLSDFTSIGSINLDLSYSTTNNGIESYTSVANGISYTTYANIGSNRYYSASLYGSLRLGSKANLFLNSSADYRDIKSKSLNITNSGWGSNSSGGLQYTLPKDFKFSLNGGYFLMPAGLQTKSVSFFFSSVGINKDILNKKVTISLSGSELFWYNKKFTMTYEDANFYRKSVSYYPGRNIRLNISYRFGELKEQIKKAIHGISNDDLKSGGSNSDSSSPSK